MKIWFFFLIFIMVISNVYSLGLAPAKSDFEFKESSQESAFRIIVDDVPAKVLLTKEGELGQFINLEKEVLILDEKETWVKFKVNFPNNLPPGERKGGILVLEVPKDNGNENIVMAATAIMHQVKVNVPYPGKYVTGKMFITNAKVDSPIEFKMGLINYGSEKIEEAKATIVIKSPTNEELGVFFSDKKSIMPGNEEVLSGFWQTQNPGSYRAEATVEYDGNTFELEQNFNIGELELAIEDIKVNNFKIGQIAKLDVYLRNKWNKPLNVDGRIEIFKKDKLISSFNTLPVEIKEKSSSIMEAYWNTEGMETGEYDISIKASYEGKTTEKTFSSIVSIDNIKLKDYVSGNVAVSKDSGRTTILIIAVIVLIILNIALFIYISRRLKKVEY